MTVTVSSIQDDHRRVTTEMFAVVLDNPSYAMVGDGEGVGTIEDDDDPPMLSVHDGRADRRCRYDVAFTVSLAGETAKMDDAVGWSTGDAEDSMSMA